jgi:hypothetical protein
LLTLQVFLEGIRPLLLNLKNCIRIFFHWFTSEYFKVVLNLLKSFSFAVSSVWGFWKFFLSPLGLDFEKSWSVRKLFRFYWLVSKDNQLSWMRSGDQLCSPGVFCLLIYRIFVLFRDKLMQLLPIYAKSRGRKKIVYLTLSFNGGWRFLFLHWNEGSPNSVFRRRFKHQHLTEAIQFY